MFIRIRQERKSYEKTTYDEEDIHAMRQRYLVDEFHFCAGQEMRSVSVYDTENRKCPSEIQSIYSFLIYFYAEHL